MNLPERLRNMRCQECGASLEHSQVRYQSAGPMGDAGVMWNGWFRKRYFLPVHCSDYHQRCFWKSMDVEITKEEAKWMRDEYVRLNKKIFIQLPEGER